MGISVQKTNAAILYPCPVMLWLLCALSYFAISADGVKSTCNAGSVRIGEKARITCRFEEDLRKTQHDVRLFYNTTTVLVIAWSDGSPEFHIKPGYQFDGKINDTITVEIPDAKFDQAGLYACHIVLSNADDTFPCTLKVTAKDPCPAICSTSTGFNNICISNDNTTFVHNIVIAILAGILGVFVSAFITLYIRQKRKRPVDKESRSLCERSPFVDRGLKNVSLMGKLVDTESSSMCERPAFEDQAMSALEVEKFGHQAISTLEVQNFDDFEEFSMSKIEFGHQAISTLEVENFDDFEEFSMSKIEIVDKESSSLRERSPCVTKKLRTSSQRPVLDDSEEFSMSKIEFNDQASSTFSEIISQE